MSAPETTPVPAAPVEEAKPVETPAPVVEAAPAAEAPKAEEPTPVGFLCSLFPLTFFLITFLIFLGSTQGGGEGRGACYYCCAFVELVS